MSQSIDIGCGVTIYFTVYKEQEVGLIEEHVGPDGQKCSGYVRFRQPPNDPAHSPSWVVEKREPLTLSPSILCRTCGHHGFIREGRWVPA